MFLATNINSHQVNVQYVHPHPQPHPEHGFHESHSQLAHDHHAEFPQGVHSLYQYGCHADQFAQLYQYEFHQLDTHKTHIPHNHPGICHTHHAHHFFNIPFASADPHPHPHHVHTQYTYDHPSHQSNHAYLSLPHSHQFHQFHLDHGDDNIQNLVLVFHIQDHFQSRLIVQLITHDFDAYILNAHHTSFVVNVHHACMSMFL
jgi:hypothetical protein